MSSVSIAFQTDKPLSAYGPLAATAESYGFDGVTVYNDMLYQPAWLPLLEVARATRTVRVGTAAVNPFTCHPINIASQIALIDEVAPGRTYLGIARGGWLDFVGLHPRRVVTALREAFGCVRHLLRQRIEPYPGEVFPLAGGDSLRWQIERPEIPFLLGSWGPQTIRACVGDGDANISEVKLGGSANPDIIAHYRQIIDAAAAQRSTSQYIDPRNGQDQVKIVVGAVTVVDEDGAAARALARREVSLYLPIVAKLDPSFTLDPELAAHLEAAAARYDFDHAATLVSDELLDKFAFAGTPDHVAAQAQALFAAGAARVEFGTPHGLTPAEGVRLLGERVLPALHP